MLGLCSWQSSTVAQCQATPFGTLPQSSEASLPSLSESADQAVLCVVPTASTPGTGQVSVDVQSLRWLFLELLVWSMKEKKTR